MGLAGGGTQAAAPSFIEGPGDGGDRHSQQYTYR